MITFRLSDIQWDRESEGKIADIDLPASMIVEAEDENGAIDAASDKTGFCIHGATVERATPSGYIEIAGGYSYAPLRVGLTVRNPEGREVYCRPGDDEAAMRANIDALYEVGPRAKRAIIADMTLGEYFA